MGKMESSGTFGHMIGSPLCSVTFIWSYFQFVIGSETMSAYTAPIVEDSGKLIGHLDDGYRDALCAEIGKKVVNVSDNKFGMLLRFEDGVQFRISFLAKNRIVAGPESLVLSNQQGEIVVVGDAEHS